MMIRKFAAALLLAAFAIATQACVGPNCGATGGGAPGGSNGQIQYNNSGAFGGITTPSGDCTITVPGGVISCTHANGAANITSGTIDSVTFTNSILGAGTRPLSTTSTQSSTAYNLVAGDAGLVVQYIGSGPASWTATSAVTLGQGFSVCVENRGSDASSALTLTPAAGLINSGGSITVPYGKGICFVDSGANFFANSYPWLYVAIDTTTAETLANKTLTSPVINGATSSGSTSIDLSGNSGAFKTPTGANQLSGAVTITDATTPSATTASGKTNTGNFTVNGKTSGSLKITTADATAQAVTFTVAAQTTGASTVTIPDMGGASDTVSFLGKTETFTGVKTFGAGVIKVTADTFANQYTACSGHSGQIYPVNNFGTAPSLWMCDGTDLSPVGRSVTVMQSGVHMALLGSGTIGNNGALTLGTALQRTYSEGMWVYWEANKICTSGQASPAVYWTTFSSTTVGQIWNNTYTSGIPTPPASPTAFSCTGPGAYTTTTATLRQLYAITLPANSVTANGSLLTRSATEQTGTAQTKTFNVRLGSTPIFQTTDSSTTNFDTWKFATTRAMNSRALQFTPYFSNDTGASTSGTNPFTSVALTSDQTLNVAISVNTATDNYVVQFIQWSIEE